MNHNSAKVQAVAATVSQLQDAAFREQLRDADIITVMDENQNMHCFYGLAVLEECAAGRGAEWDWIKWFMFPVDFRTDEPEFLAAAIHVLKGEPICYPMVP